jgi:hypothetical protein
MKANKTKIKIIHGVPPWFFLYGNDERRNGRSKETTEQEGCLRIWARLKLVGIRDAVGNVGKVWMMSGSLAPVGFFFSSFFRGALAEKFVGRS